MKMFGRKAAGREESRPALEFRRARFACGAVGDVPLNYEGQMRALYLRNAIAQRAVRMIADAVGDAPLSAAPEVLALVQARSAGQALTATVAGHLLLHGKPLPFRGGVGGGASPRPANVEFAARPHPNPSPEGEGLRFAGYAAVFDTVDRGGDVIRAGAFGAAPAPVPLLWHHHGQPIGAIERIAPDARGLRVIGRIDDRRGRDRRASVHGGTARECGSAGAAGGRGDLARMSRRAGRPAVPGGDGGAAARRARDNV
ncbi:hypothetical protein GCM10011395_31310 [Sphingomonas psychrolutea]|uniref:Prohead serine protease domain-containing protein n=1 Tax=Sphingomonas psychrolutea TaxID=1259676 RepID=A0ABQ1H4X6_9SPHN|nr:hypothetical protein GCM10011395_31310 [Sphingomonas psychrolutea]